MSQQGLLDTQESWNLLMSQYVRMKHFAYIDHILKLMTLHGFTADLDTYKIIMKGLRAIDTREAYVVASYHYWRRFIVNYPVMKPDIVVINLMIDCCRKIKSLERAFYFVSVMHQCDIVPDEETIRLLLEVCNISKIFNVHLHQELLKPK